MKKSRFRVGDYAILARPNRLKQLTGEEVMIMQQEEPRQAGKDLVFAYTVRVLSNGEVYPASDEQLDKLPDPNTPSSWENCVWKPKKP